jgi:hypothetical protein
MSRRLLVDCRFLPTLRYGGGISLPALQTGTSTPMFNEAFKAGAMAFILGTLLFVVVVGILDARLPWPPSRRKTP